MRVKKLILICVALFALALIPASLAGADKPDKPPKPAKPESAKNIAAQQCAALKQADKAAFRSLYGPRRSMRNCIKAETGEATSTLKNAAKECKAAQAADPVLFEETYGDDDPYTTTPNAYGKCVSSKAGAKHDDEVAEFKNAAKECKAERAADPEGFKATYGSVKSGGRNALGKCVSANVRADRIA